MSEVYRGICLDVLAKIIDEGASRGLKAVSKQIIDALRDETRSNETTWMTIHSDSQLDELRPPVVALDEIPALAIAPVDERTVDQPLPSARTTPRKIKGWSPERRARFAATMARKAKPATPAALAQSFANPARLIEAPSIIVGRNDTIISSVRRRAEIAALETYRAHLAAGGKPGSDGIEEDLRRNYGLSEDEIVAIRDSLATGRAIHA